MSVSSTENLSPTPNTKADKNAEEPSESSVTSADMQNLGTISVSVTRVAHVKDQEPSQPSKVPFKQISQVPKKFLGATGITDAVR